jgi:hypothetical protein
MNIAKVHIHEIFDRFVFTGNKKQDYEDYKFVKFATHSLLSSITPIVSLCVFAVYGELSSRVDRK